MLLQRRPRDDDAETGLIDWPFVSVQERISFEPILTRYIVTSFHVCLIKRETIMKLVKVLGRTSTR